MALYMHSTTIGSLFMSFLSKNVPQTIFPTWSCHPSSTSLSAEKLALGVHSGEFNVGRVTEKPCA